eukprot:scaffold239528_cov35-Tisochrysis_lutea.AAC.2
MASACAESDVGWPTRRVCLGVSGSVAAVKTPELCAALLDSGVSVDLVLTEPALKLLHSVYRGERPWEQLSRLVDTHGRSGDHAGQPALQLFRDSDEWDAYREVGMDAVLHVELAKRNSLLLIAPLCANTLASCALGLCGSLLTSVVRAWYYDLDDDFARPLAATYGGYAICKPFMVAPAMNTFMWHQRITSEHLETLRGRGVHVIPPVSKVLACGDSGMGAMATVSTIAEEAVRQIDSHMAAVLHAKRCGRLPFAP